METNDYRTATARGAGMSAKEMQRVPWWKSPVAWILGGIVILAIVLYMVNVRKDNTAQSTSTTDATTTTQPVSQSVPAVTPAESGSPATANDAGRTGGNNGAVGSPASDAPSPTTPPRDSAKSPPK